MNIIFIINILGIVIGFWLIAISGLENRKFGIFLGICFILLHSWLTVIVTNETKEKKAMEDTPKAIDVYRDRTELRITYQGGIAVDTVVVWK